MASIINSEVIASKIVNPSPKISKIPYEIPDRYRNSFYLANAAFFESTNWFLHKAYEVIFPTLKENLKCIKNYAINDNEVAEKVENVVKILDQCNNILDIRFPIKRDNGKYEIIRGFSAHYGLASGYNAAMGGKLLI